MHKALSNKRVATACKAGLRGLRASQMKHLASAPGRGMVGAWQATPTRFPLARPRLMQPLLARPLLMQPLLMLPRLTLPHLTLPRLPLPPLTLPRLTLAACIRRR
jgi:hypothetical protein